MISESLSVLHALFDLIILESSAARVSEILTAGTIQLYH